MTGYLWTGDNDTLRRKGIKQDPCDISIIGAAVDVPKANTLDQFWDVLLSGKNTITEFDNKSVANARQVNLSHVLSGLELFDYRLFGMSKSEADLLDPQLRLSLKCAWRALESAGVDPDRYNGRIGCYTSVGSSHYLLNILSLSLIHI